MNRHPISIFRLLSRTNTLTLDPCNWLPRHLTGARMRAPQILVIYREKLQTEAETACTAALPRDRGTEEGNLRAADLPARTPPASSPRYTFPSL